MSGSVAIGIAVLCVVLAGAETLHGIARAVVLVPRVGQARAIQLSIISGTLLAFAVCYLLVPRIGLVGLLPHLYLGLLLAVFMASFDIVIGRFVARMQWSQIWRDFNPASGNYLSIGLTLLMFMPALVWWINSQ